ncbi:Mitochondrial import inner membrane translocase subunit TIM14-3 [Platanthera guangdongensis]|uniref:Mitochondrial import inner membrane translocase subunit TIM14-3 n=1 Tax=Platanthera guangdongensis TaxID=2320717 RepID=A0ABR2LWJ4_9ASPA
MLTKWTKTALTIYCTFTSIKSQCNYMVASIRSRRSYEVTSSKSRRSLILASIRNRRTCKATPLLAGLAVAAAALAGRYGVQAWQVYKARPVVPRMRKFYEGGFQPSMTRREASLILGISLRMCSLSLLAELRKLSSIFFTAPGMNLPACSASAEKQHSQC